MLTLEGLPNQGQGQVLRTALSLSMVTGQPFQLQGIRNSSSKPGLTRQDLTTILAAARICKAELTEAHIGSGQFSFQPGSVQAGDYVFKIGNAKSVVLLLQTLLPALWSAGAPSSLMLLGGTHNPDAPPFESLEKAWLPILAKMGAAPQVHLERAGFAPGGGGRLLAQIQPVQKLKPLVLTERGALQACKATAIVAHLNTTIAERELRTIEKMLSWDRACTVVYIEKDSQSSGNLLNLEIKSEQATEVFTGFGKVGLLAEDVASHVAQEAQKYMDSTACVGAHLASQLLVPMALAGAGALHASGWSFTAAAQAEVIEKFLDIEIQATESGPGLWQIQAH